MKRRCLSNRRERQGREVIRKCFSEWHIIPWERSRYLVYRPVGWWPVQPIPRLAAHRRSAAPVK
jgi:hypothetical protein